MWSFHMLNMIDRKGVGDFLPDYTIFHSVFHKLTDEEQGLVELNVVGAFQTGAQKSKWDTDITDCCELCGESDTREHRLLQYTALSDVRHQFPSARETLRDVRQEWIYMPIPRCHDSMIS